MFISLDFQQLLSKVKNPTSKNSSRLSIMYGETLSKKNFRLPLPQSGKTYLRMFL